MIEILRAYFLLGLCYRDILRRLASMHGIVISMRTLQRLLKAVVACCLFGTKPLPQTMLTYCELGSQKHIQVKFESIYCELQS